MYIDIMDNNSNDVGAVEVKNGPVEGMIELTFHLDGTSWVITSMEVQSTADGDVTRIVVTK
jgi:hypothetical protein